MLVEADHLRELRDALRVLISDARLMATQPWVGGVYQHFVQTLKRVQFLCELIVWDRLDGRWSMLPVLFADVHKQCGAWIRSHVERQKFKVFADMLGALEKHVDDLQHKATGRIGNLYAKPLRAERTAGRAVGWRGRVSSGGVLIPDEVAA